jgi:UDP-N-acetylglucosamine 3-dehydrogenase
MHSKTLARIAPDVQRFYASRDPDRAVRFHEQFRGAGVFESYDDAISAAAIDVVLVATPPSSHLELTLRALRAGKHTIVEKPPFLRASDFDVVIDAERTSQRRVFVAENYFYKPLVRRLRDILSTDQLGEILFLHINALKEQRAEDWRADTTLSGGGALFEGGIHWVDFLANIGLEVSAARGFRPGVTAGPERSMLLVLEYTNGAIGTLSYSWEVHSPLKGIRISRIYGTRGTVVFESNGIFLAQTGRRRRILIPGLREIAGYAPMFRDFLAAMQEGREPEFSTARARRDLELIEQAYHTASRKEIGDASA